MFNLILIFILLLFILLILCEMDRNYIIPYDSYSYYIDNFPKQVMYGIHNSIYRLYNNKFIFDCESFPFHNFLIKNLKK